ncbi:putative GTPase [Saccharomycopsis crataegensis]|uniref:GTPase n=1 Tax=Saccharomycopsis crataegensis TaxID=43959 RepID=A0AAV5QUW8_9ASCO|nr:putative GTPase [Saccharomycopsis crataegensis]
MSRFIPRLKFPDYRIPMADFKGHHVKALKRIGGLAPQIDLVLEIRDSRAPISTRNVLFDRALKGIDRVILYSKKDSTGVNKSLLDQWHTNESYMFIDCRKKSDARYLIEIAKQKFQLMTPPPPLGLRMLIIGMPNVGKSTLVNNLRDVGLQNDDKANNTISGPSKKLKKVAKTGGMPGVTRSTSEIIRVSRNPSILLYDTPGISLPKVNNSETMIVLSLVGSINPTFIDPVIQADYLLFLMNLQDPSGKLYSKYLKEPTNDIMLLLKAIAKTIGKDNIRNKYTNEKTFDETGTAIYWVDRWRQGKEEKIIFDTHAIERYTKFMEKVVDYKQLESDERDRIDQMDVVLNKNPRLDSKGNYKPKSYMEKQMDKQNVLFKFNRG